MAGHVCCSRVKFAEQERFYLSFRNRTQQPSIAVLVGLVLARAAWKRFAFFFSPPRPLPLFWSETGEVQGRGPPISRGRGKNSSTNGHSEGWHLTMVSTSSFSCPLFGSLSPKAGQSASNRKVSGCTEKVQNSLQSTGLLHKAIIPAKYWLIQVS